MEGSYVSPARPSDKYKIKMKSYEKKGSKLTAWNDGRGILFSY